MDIDQKVDEFFKEHEAVIDGFAKKHGLTITRRPKEVHAWHLDARHPRGGDFGLIISAFDAEIFSVTAVWQLNDYENCLMYTKHKNYYRNEISAVTDNLILERVETALRESAGWESGSWNDIANCRAEWGKLPAEEIEKRQRYPHLKDVVL